MRDFERTIVSQYSSSPILIQLISDLNDCISPDADLEVFYDLIWNIETAVGYGLDVWGRIVGVNRVLQVATGKYFGFAEAGNLSADPFNQSPFYNGVPLTSNFALTDEAYRRLIFAKAAQNITDCSIPAINKILMNLFPGRGNAYVTDGIFTPLVPYFGFAESGTAVGWDQAPFADLAPSRPLGMNLTYVFEFALVPFEVAIVTQSGVLPKPTGVLAGFNYLTVSV